MKRLLALLLALLLCFSLLACESDDDDEGKSGKEAKGPLLYKVTDDEGNVAWLFGSIHVGRDDFYPLPDYVLDAFDGSDSLAVEVDIVAFESDRLAQMSAMQQVALNDGTIISRHISSDLYADAVEIMKDLGIYNALMDFYMPILWSNLIDSAMYPELGADPQLGIDRHLLNRAKDADMPILDIESAEFQYGMMAGFSEELQIYLLEQSVESAQDPEMAEERLQTLMDLWMSGDEDAFRAYLEDNEDVSEDEEDLYEEYNNAMLKDRNEGMADFVEEALESGDEVFVCVGAAHVVGDDALVDLMTQRGYTVERITE